MLVDHPLEQTRPEQDEGKLAALTDHQGEPARCGGVEAPPAPEQIKDGRLDQEEAEHDGDQSDRLCDEHAKIDRHADGDEEHRKQ